MFSAEGAMWKFAGDQLIVDEFRKIPRVAVIPLLSIGILNILEGVGLREFVTCVGAKISTTTWALPVLHQFVWVFILGVLLANYKTVLLAFRTIIELPKEKPSRSWTLAFLMLVVFSGIVLFLKREDIFPTFQNHVIITGTWLKFALVAVKEEIVFRLLFYYSLIRLIGRMPAFVLTTLGFASMHVSYNVWFALLILPPGYLLTYLMTRYGTLWVPISFHIGGNFIVRLITKCCM